MEEREGGKSKKERRRREKRLREGEGENKKEIKWEEGREGSRKMGRRKMRKKR